MIRPTLTSLCCATTLAVPVGNALALSQSRRSEGAAAKRIVKTVTVDGPIVKCPIASGGYSRRGAWGSMEVELMVVKTEILNGMPRSVSIKITGASWPVFPDHTPRTKYINAQALPILQRETLRLNANAATSLANVSGATMTTGCWQTSLQAALLQAKKP